ncbi:MAG: Uma2 family endonuclease [Cyanobacteria bacterium P01_G01_bin.38]
MQPSSALESNFTAVDEIQWPPTDLWSDEPPLESDLHREQIELLIRILKLFWQDRNDFYITGNLTIYYNEQQLKSRDFRGPDLFVVLNTEKKDRKSWVVWGENGQYPDLILEILSSSTEKVDRGIKKELYQTVFRTPNYFWFDPVSLEFQGFHLVDGRYEPIQPTEQGWLWSQALGLYLGSHDHKLRWFTADGQLIASPEEQAEQERQRAEQARQQAEQERQRAEQAERELAKLRAKLKAQTNSGDS